MSASTVAVDPSLSFWPTPPEVAEDLVAQVLLPGFGDGAAAGGVPQVRILEPSAGVGHLVRCVRQHLPGAHITAVEPSPERAAALRAQGAADEVIGSTLEGFLCSAAYSAMAGTFQPFDGVVMNPPFTLAGRSEVWAEHFLAIYNDPYLLAPDGQVSAVVPRVVMTGRSKLVRAVRELLHGMAECERGAFSQVGAQVSTARIWAQKPVNGVKARDLR